MSVDARAGDYFDTPERHERQQLLLHLVRNAGEVIYLRGPDGAGKTLFARRMFEQLGESLYGAWIVAGKEPDFVAAVNRQLSVATDRASPWPDSLMFALGERELLLVVDDADAIDAQSLSHIAALRQRGGHVLLIGRGGLPPGATVSPQFMDLPGFDAQQSAAFLRSRANAAAAAITDDVAGALHRAAQGMPGPLLDAMQVLAAGHPAAARPRTRPGLPSGPALKWSLLAGVGVLLLGVVLLFQDSINEAVAPGAPTEPDAAVAVNAPATTRPAGPGQPTSQVTRPEPGRSESLSLPAPPIETPVVMDGPEREPGPARPDDGKASDAIDPLEAVMLDALEAAREAAPEQAEMPSSEEPPATPAKPKASATSPAQSPKPVVPPPASEPRVAVASAPPAVAATKVETAGASVAAGEPEVATAAADSAVRETPAPVEDRSIPAKAPAASESRATEAPAPPQPAPVVDRTRPKPKPAPKPEPAKVANKGWLETRQPSHYTLQLVGARDRAAIEQFVRRHGIQQPYAVFERNLKGAPWYSLVAGEYPDRAAAVAARAALPAGLERSGVWPRTFESIYKLTQ